MSEAKKVVSKEELWKIKCFFTVKDSCLERSHGGAASPSTSLGKSLFVQICAFHATSKVGLHLNSVNEEFYITEVEGNLPGGTWPG